MAKPLNLIDKLQKLEAVHKNKYAFPDGVAATGKTRVLCPEHGEFFSAYETLVKGSGCRLCAFAKQTFSASEAVGRLAAKHKNRYAYVEDSYTGASGKIEIICKEHGKFLQSYQVHLRGGNCPRCAAMARTVGTKFTEAEAFARLSGVHSGAYTYVAGSYSGATSYITAICKTHGEFRQLYTNHLSGNGCPACALLSRSSLRRLTPAEALADLVKVHGSRYSYSNVASYTNNRHMLDIVCKEHGRFLQAYDKHASGQGCPKCACVGPSKVEATMFNFISAQIACEQSYRGWDSNKSLELDVFVPSKAIAVEFNGLYWHSSKFCLPSKHLQKQRRAGNVGISLIQLFEDEWRDRESVCKNLILSRLGLQTGGKVGARKCSVILLSHTAASEFYEANHIQGYVRANQHYGLVDSAGSLVAAMSFRVGSGRGKVEHTVFELVRYATAKQVAGGASKLLAKFIADNPTAKRIVSFSDNRLFTGKLYEQLGFTKSEVLQPDYRYLVGNKRMHKAGFQRKRLAKLMGDKFRPELSEKQNCELMGWYQIYDCGLTRWELPIT